MQDPDRPGEVEALAKPARAPCLPVGREAAFPMDGDEGLGRVAGTAGGAWTSGIGRPLGVLKESVPSASRSTR